LRKALSDTEPNAPTNVADESFDANRKEFLVD
jgi:hypothetical protein